MKQNVIGTERTARIVLGMILVPVGFFLSGLWMLLFILAGVAFLVTGIFQY